MHNYKTLLNAMGAIFYTDHGMKQTQSKMLRAWMQAFKDSRTASGADSQMNVREQSRAVPAIQIDTELANKEYEDHNMEQLDEDDMQPASAAMNIEGDEESHSSDFSVPSGVDPNDKDQVQDHLVQRFLKELPKVGHYSKQILNYSYPPLLYQRGDESEDGGAGEDDGEGNDEESMDEEELSHNQFGEELDVGDLLGRELGLDDIDIEENGDLRQQQAELDGASDTVGRSPQDVDEDQEIEQMVDGFFSKGADD